MVRRTVLLLLAVATTLSYGVPLAAAEEEETAPPVPATGAEPDNSKSSLKLVGGQSAVQTVSLSRVKDQTLRGTLLVSMRSEVGTRRLIVSYFPSGAAGRLRAGSVSVAPGFSARMKKGQTKSIPLVFTLPAKASPQDLHGVVYLKSRGHEKTKRTRLELSVTGTGSALTGVSIQPEKLAIKVGSGSPFGNPDHTSAGVQLVGPGVPALFAPGAAPLSFNLLLHTANGGEVRATLTAPEQSTSSPTTATAQVEIDGNLGPGKYEGSAPISSLSAEAPKLAIEIESGNSFVCALLAVFLGAVLGGGLYLASNRSRRKALLRDQMKSLIARYETTRDRMNKEKGENEPSIWTLDKYLGEDRTAWYQVKWNAVLNFDGAVQTIWSNIHWARNEDDLDEAGKQLDELRARIVRWLTVANSISVLEAATKLKPDSLPNERWGVRETPEDTERLLQQIREIEPEDDKTTKDLIDRINRQAHWHESLAEVWHARTALSRHMLGHPQEYKPNDHTMLEGLHLAEIDHESVPEAKRSAQAQIDLKLKLAKYMEEIKATYTGPPADLELERPAALKHAVPHDPGMMLFASIAPDAPFEQTMVEETLPDAQRKETSSSRLGLDRLRGTSATEHDGTRIPAAVGPVIQRDLLWTVAIALVTSAAYIPTIYNATWGTPADYVSAFAAGFIGKAAISWAALPLFQSLKGSKTAVANAAPAPADGQAVVAAIATPAATTATATAVTDPPPAA